MDQDSGNDDGESKGRITVEAPDIEGIAVALGMELVEDPTGKPETRHSDELVEILDTIADIYEGVVAATETDNRGRSRKMVRQYADREDLSSDEVGHILRVLEGHDLVIQDGNRWRVTDGDTS